MISFIYVYYTFVIFGFYTASTSSSGTEVYQLCASHDCNAVISDGETLQNYRPPNNEFIPFVVGQTVRVFVKKANGVEAHWIAEVNGQRGKVPQNMVKETRNFFRVSELTRVYLNTSHNSSTTTPSQSSKQTIDLPMDINIEGKDGSSPLLKNNNIDQIVKERPVLGLEDIEYQTIKDLSQGDGKKSNDSPVHPNSRSNIMASSANVDSKFTNPSTNSDLNSHNDLGHQDAERNSNSPAEYSDKYKSSTVDAASISSDQNLPSSNNEFLDKKADQNYNIESNIDNLNNGSDSFKNGNNQDGESLKESLGLQEPGLTEPPLNKVTENTVETISSQKLDSVSQNPPQNTNIPLENSIENDVATSKESRSDLPTNENGIETTSSHNLDSISQNNPDSSSNSSQESNIQNHAHNPSESQSLLATTENEKNPEGVESSNPPEISQSDHLDTIVTSGESKEPDIPIENNPSLVAQSVMPNDDSKSSVEANSHKNVLDEVNINSNTAEVDSLSVSTDSVSQGVVESTKQESSHSEEIMRMNPKSNIQNITEQSSVESIKKDNNETQVEDNLTQPSPITDHTIVKDKLNNEYSSEVTLSQDSTTHQEIKYQDKKMYNEYVSDIASTPDTTNSHQESKVKDNEDESNGNGEENGSESVVNTEPNSVESTTKSDKSKISNSSNIESETSEPVSQSKDNSQPKNVKPTIDKFHHGRHPYPGLLKQQKIHSKNNVGSVENTFGEHQVVTETTKEAPSHSNLEANSVVNEQNLENQNDVLTENKEDAEGFSSIKKESVLNNDHIISEVNVIDESQDENLSTTPKDNDELIPSQPPNETEYSYVDPRSHESHEHREKVNSNDEYEVLPTSPTIGSLLDHDDFMKDGSAVCTLKDYFLSITGVILPDGLFIAFEEEVASPYMSRGKFLLLLVIAFTIILLYLCHMCVVKISREGPILKEMNSLDRKLRIMQEENNNLKQNGFASIQPTSMTGELSEVYRAKQRLESIEAALQDKVNNLQRRNDQLGNELEISQTNEDELNRMVTELLSNQKSTSSFEEAVNSLQSMLESQQKEVEDLQADLSLKTKLNEELKSELKAGKSRSSKLECQVEQLTHSLEEMTASKISLTKKLEDDRESSSTLVTENNKLSAEVEKTREILNRQEDQCERLAQEIRTLKKGLSAKEAECQVSKECLKKLRLYSESDSKDAHGKLMEMFKVIAIKSSLMSCEKSLADQANELGSQTASLREAKDRVALLESSLARAEAAAAEATKAHLDAAQKLQVVADHYRQREAHLEKELEARNAQLREATGSVTSGSTKLQSCETEIQSYKEQIDILRRAMEEQESSFKTQLTNEEKKLLDSWMTTRAAERRQEELRQENAQLRHRLTQMSKRDRDNTLPDGGASTNGSLSSPIPTDADAVPGMPLGPLPPPLMPPMFPGGPPLPPGLPPPPHLFGPLPPPPPMPYRRLPPAGRMASPPGGADRRSYSPSSNHSSRCYSPEPPRSYDSDLDRGRRYPLDNGAHSPPPLHPMSRRSPGDNWYPPSPRSPPRSVDSSDGRNYRTKNKKLMNSFNER